MAALTALSETLLHRKNAHDIHLRHSRNPNPYNGDGRIDSTQNLAGQQYEGGHPVTEITTVTLCNSLSGWETVDCYPPGPRHRSEAKGRQCRGCLTAQRNRRTRLKRVYTKGKPFYTRGSCLSHRDRSRAHQRSYGKNSQVQEKKGL